MPLATQLEECRRKLRAAAAPELLDVVRASLSDLRESGILARAVRAGDTAPVFRLPDRRGGVVALSDLLRAGPAVISFFWCVWCPFCRLELEALAEAHPDIERQGATLVGISPHIRDGRPDPTGRPEPPFRLLRDAGARVAKRHGLAFRVPRNARPAYAALGYPQEAQATRPGHWWLLIPATYVVGTTGRVVLSYLDTDYTTRLEPAEIITALKRLRR